MLVCAGVCWFLWFLWFHTYIEELRVHLHHAVKVERRHAQDLRTETCLILSEQECLRAHMLRAFTPEPGQSLECSSLDTLRQMIALGLGISILPIFALRSPLYSPQALTLRPLDSQPERSIFLAWRTSFPRHKALDLVRRGVQLGSWQFTTAASPEPLSPLLSNHIWQAS